MRIVFHAITIWVKNAGTVFERNSEKPLSLKKNTKDSGCILSQKLFSDPSPHSQNRLVKSLK